MLQSYRNQVAERAVPGIPPQPLSAPQTAELIELIRKPPAGEEALLVELLADHVPSGMDEAAKLKASFLAAVARGRVQVPLISRHEAAEMLGAMGEGHNIEPLIELLDDPQVAQSAAAGLQRMLFLFDFFDQVADKAKAGNVHARAVIQTWTGNRGFTGHLLAYASARS